MGLLSAVITSFMLYLQPKLSPDPGDETLALLRVIAYNADPSAFDKAPSVPNPTSTPLVLVASEYLLYAAWIVTFSGGSYALAIMFALELGFNSRATNKHIKHLFKFVVRVTIFGLWVSFSLVFTAATLQLPLAITLSTS